MVLTRKEGIKELIHNSTNIPKAIEEEALKYVIEDTPFILWGERPVYDLEEAIKSLIEWGCIHTVTVNVKGVIYE